MADLMQMLASQPWLMLPEHLEAIAAVVRREHDVEALAARVGKPLESTRRVEMHGSVAVVPVVGGIYRYANLFTEICGATSTQVLATDIASAAKNPDVSHIVLNMDSPGGQAKGISELADLVRSVEKPVIAHVGDLSASAAYWIASAADHITASKTAFVGSIGAVYTFRLLDDPNTVEVVSAVSPKKRPDLHTAAGRAQVQTWADRLGDEFVAAVAEGRGVTTDDVLESYGQGDIMIASDALEAGMIDEVTTLESLIGALQS